MTGQRRPAYYWDDFTLGQRITSATRTIDRRMVHEFSTLTGDHNPLHDEAGTGTPTLVHGMLGMSIAIGLIEQTGIHHGSTIAMLDIQSWDFRRPVHVGDSVFCRMTVVGKDPSYRDTRRGVIVRHLSLLGEDSLIRQEGVITLLVKRRP